MGWNDVAPYGSFAIVGPIRAALPQILDQATEAQILALWHLFLAWVGRPDRRQKD